MKADLEEFGLDDDLPWIMSKSKPVFKNLVKKQARELALENLLRKKEGHSKMENLSYTRLEIQEYLRDPKLSINQAKAEPVWKDLENILREDSQPNQKSTDTQCHSFQCRVIRENITENRNYMEVLSSKMDNMIVYITSSL